MMMDDAEVQVVLHGDVIPACLDGVTTTARMLSFDALMAAEVDASSVVSSERDGADICTVMFASGALGRPKGVMVSDRSILRLAVEQGFASFEPGRRVTRVVAGDFDMGGCDIWGGLLNGGCAVFLEHGQEVDPDMLASSVSDRRIDSLFLTTTMFNAAVAARVDVLGGTHQVLFGGEAADVEIARDAIARWPAVQFTHVYGPNEAAGLASYHAVDGLALTTKTLPIGRPVRATSLYVLDTNLNPVPRGMPGVLYIGGDIADGYVRDPAGTAEVFLADPFSDHSGARMFRTRDLVRRRHDGGLEYLRRLDHQITLHGHRIEPGEIEAAIRSRVPGAGEIYVNARREDNIGKSEPALLAWVVNLPPDNDTERKLRSDLCDILPAWMVPQQIISVDVMPISADGTVDHRALVMPKEAGKAEMLNPVIETETERALMDIWSTLLNGAPVDAGDTFFDVGGHSLLGVKLVAIVRQRFGVTLQLRSIFEHPEFRAMAAAIDASCARPGAAAAAEEPAIKRRARRGAADGGRSRQ